MKTNFEQQSTYHIECTIDTLPLDIPIEARFELDWPFRERSDTKLTVSATVASGEVAVAALPGAGITSIDIIVVEVDASITGADPAPVSTMLGDAPINDFDLTADTDNNGTPGRIP